MRTRYGKFTQALALGALFLCAAGLIALVQGCGGGDDELPQENPVPLTAESVAMGAQLFENNCQVCHGPDGTGTDLAPDLTIHIPTRDEAFLFARITRGFNGVLSMPSFEDTLTETERWHLVNFLRDSFGDLEPVLPDDADAE